jgi:hypothetical protein
MGFQNNGAAHAKSWCCGLHRCINCQMVCGLHSVEYCCWKAMVFELVTVPILPLFSVTRQPHATLCKNDHFRLYLRHTEISTRI